MTTIKFEATARFENRKLELKIGEEVFMILGADRTDVMTAIKTGGKKRRRGKCAGGDRTGRNLNGTRTSSVQFRQLHRLNASFELVLGPLTPVVAIE